MTPGWLSEAMDSAFGEAAPACLVCGDDRQVWMVAFAGERMDEPIPCPSCRRDPPPIPIYVYDQRIDTPRGAA